MGRMMGSVLSKYQKIPINKQKWLPFGSLQGDLACVNFLAYFALFLFYHLSNLSQNTLFYLSCSMPVFPICSQRICQNANSFPKLSISRIFSLFLVFWRTFKSIAFNIKSLKFSRLLIYIFSGLDIIVLPFL